MDSAAVTALSVLATLIAAVVGAFLGSYLQGRGVRAGERRLWAVELQRRMTALRQLLFDLRETVERALTLASGEDRQSLLADGWAYFFERWDAVQADSAAYLRLVPGVDDKFRSALVAQSSALQSAVLSGDAYNVRSALRPLLETVDSTIQALDEVIGIRRH